MKIYQSYSSAGTKDFGRKLAAKIAERKSRNARRKNALVVALSGDLGSGKTTFIRGFTRGLGIKKRSASPTFILFRRFKINDLRFKNVYHIDAYRLRRPAEFMELGLKEILHESKNVVLIEWAEKLKKYLPKGTIWIKFEHGRKENERTIKLEFRI